MNKKNCIVYLCRSTDEDVESLCKSLALLFENHPPSPTTDVIIFHQPSFVKKYIPMLEQATMIRRVVGGEGVPLRFIQITFTIPPYPLEIFNAIPEYFPHPYAGVSGHSAEHSPGFSLGYRSMCRFFAGAIFNHPVMDEYEYYMRLDSDSFILSPVGRDLFQWAEEVGCYYGYLAPAVQLDHPAVTEGLRQSVVNWTTDSGLHTFRPAFEISDRAMYYTNFEICKIDWFRSEAYQKFWNFIDSTGGIYVHRWGDAPIRYLGVNLFMDQINIVPVPGMHYQHGAEYKT